MEPVPQARPAHVSASADPFPGGDPVDILAANSRTFRFAARFLPAGDARRIAEVYAFCRHTDDLVDKAPDAAPGDLEERLDRWEGLARLAHAGVTTGIPLADLPMGRMGRAGIPFHYAEELIRGMRMDIRPRHYRTLAELEVYAHRAAGVVGQWLAEMAGVSHPWALERAADLGQAMQITNILRDVGEDWARGRLYLPLDLMARHGLSIADLDAAASGGWKGSPPKAWRDLMEELIAVAERKYQRALTGIPWLPAWFQRTVLVAALVYRDIHEALRRNGYDNFSKRAVVGEADKLRIAFKTLWLLPSIRALFPGEPADRAGFGPCMGPGAAVRAGSPEPAVRPHAEPGQASPQAPCSRTGAGGFSGLRDGGGAWAVPLLALALLGGSTPAAAASPRDEAQAPPERAEVRSQGLRDLEAIGARMRAHPDSLGPRLDRLRVLYVLGVKDEAVLADAEKALADLDARRDPDPALANLLRAYRGALLVAHARHVFSPNRKLEYLKRAQPLLDSAVALRGTQAEVRYLRLVSGYYLPFFLGRKDEVKEDFRALAEVLPGALSEFPPRWYLSVAGFVLDKGRLRPEQEADLRQAMDRARVLAARVEAGGSAKQSPGAGAGGAAAETGRADAGTGG